MKIVEKILISIIMLSLFSVIPLSIFAGPHAAFTAMTVMFSAFAVLFLCVVWSDSFL